MANRIGWSAVTRYAYLVCLVCFGYTHSVIICQVLFTYILNRTYVHAICTVAGVCPVEYRLPHWNTNWMSLIHGITLSMVILHHFIFTNIIASHRTDVAWVNWHLKRVPRDTISHKGYFANFHSIIYPDFHNHQSTGHLFSISLIFLNCYHRLVVRYECYSNFITLLFAKNLYHTLWY